MGNNNRKTARQNEFNALLSNQAQTLKQIVCSGLILPLLLVGGCSSSEIKGIAGAFGRAGAAMTDSSQGTNFSGHYPSSTNSTTHTKTSAPYSQSYVQTTNTYAKGYFQNTNPYGPRYVQTTNPYGQGYVQDTNPYGQGYIQDTNSYGTGYVQDKSIFGLY